MATIEDAAIITVRNSSSRLPNKATMIIKENLKSIDIVIKRAKMTNLPVILCTSIDKSDDIFEQISLEHEIMFFRGSLLNKIKRWSDCFEKFKIKNALLLDGDDLCHNFNIGKRAMEQLKSTNADMITNPSDIVTGFFTFAVNKIGLLKMLSVASDQNQNTDVITKFIEKGKLITEFVKLEDYERNEKIRLTLDYMEDLQFFKKLYEKIDILENGENVINFLLQNKELIQINFHRQKDFLENQAKFNEGIK